MREIKFMAYHTIQKRMFKVYALGIDFITEDTFDGIELGVNYFTGEDLNNIKIMQYTGLKDKNEKEIYDGHVVRNSNKSILTLPDDKGHYLVKWQEGIFCATIGGSSWLEKKPRIVFEKIGQGMSIIFSQEQIEIIGNIHENPELIS